MTKSDQKFVKLFVCRQHTSAAVRRFRYSAEALLKYVVSYIASLLTPCICVCAAIRTSVKKINGTRSLCITRCGAPLRLYSEAVAALRRTFLLESSILLSLSWNESSVENDTCVTLFFSIVAYKWSFSVYRINARLFLFLLMFKRNRI